VQQAAAAAHLSECRAPAALMAESNRLGRCHKLVRLNLGQAAGYLRVRVERSKCAMYATPLVQGNRQHTKAGGQAPACAA